MYVFLLMVCVIMLILFSRNNDLNHCKVKMAEATSLQPRGSAAESNNDKKMYILALDVGTTSVRAHIYDKQANILGVGIRKVSPYIHGIYIFLFFF